MACDDAMHDRGSLVEMGLEQVLAAERGKRTVESGIKQSSIPLVPPNCLISCA